MESEDSSASGQDLSSRSSSHLQRLDQCLLGLSRQYRVLREPGSGRRGCVRGFSSDGEFDRHLVAATFSQHYGQLQDLLDERTKLLFLREFARCSRTAASFVARLAGLVEQENLSLAARRRGLEQPAPTWLHGVGALCAELRTHVNHWDCVCRSVGANSWPQRACMRQALGLRAQQALTLVERYIHTSLSILGLTEPASVPQEALEDLLTGVTTFNQVVRERRSCSGRGASRPGQNQPPSPFSVARLLAILAEHRVRVPAARLHRWAADQSAQGQCWSKVDLSSLQAGLSPTAGANYTCPGANYTCPGAPPAPLAAFVKQDREFSERLFRALVSSTDLLAAHVMNRPRPDPLEPPASDHVFQHKDMEGADDGRRKPVQWQDVAVALLAQYRHLLWRDLGRTLLALFSHPGPHVLLGSLNQCKEQTLFLVVKELQSGYREGLIPAECEGIIIDLSTQMVADTAFQRWDEVMCASLGTGVKDKCFPGSSVRTSTIELLLQLFHPLHTVLDVLKTATASRTGEEPRLRPKGTALSIHLGALCRAVATVHCATFWVRSKAYQFLSSWSLNKFLLVTQGDLKTLWAAVEGLVLQVKELDMGAEGDPIFIRQQAELLTRATTELQVFSELVLKIFSMDCKKMAVEIFEQTMPSGRQWRVGCKTELPSSPSDYASLAARSVIGQVLAGLQPLPDEARGPALMEAMTAFMEAWMEHILKQKIKFSLQGALQLKQDFDLIRDLIRSEEYHLSEDMLQRVLSLRVFQQVDNAIVCLLQQPVTKTYLSSCGWEPWWRCCPNSSHPVDQGTGSLQSLESMEIQAARNQALREAQGSLAPRLTSGSPLESYLAVTQQEWLALRVQSGSRWKLPGLHCMNKSEP